jgi:hypothetical protein
MKDKITNVILSCCAIIGGIFTFSFKDFNFFKKEPGITFDGNKALNSFFEKKYESHFLENENLKLALKNTLNENQVNLDKLSSLQKNLTSLENQIKETSEKLKNASNNAPYSNYFIFIGFFAIFYATKYFLLKRKVKNSKKILTLTIDALKKDNLSLKIKKEQLEKAISSKNNLNEKIKNFNTQSSELKIETSRKVKHKIKKELNTSIIKINKNTSLLTNKLLDQFKKKLDHSRTTILDIHLEKIKKKFVSNYNTECLFKESSYLLCSIAAFMVISQIIEFGLTDNVRASFISNLNSELFVNSSYNIGVTIKDFENPSKQL